MTGTLFAQRILDEGGCLSAPLEVVSLGYQAPDGSSPAVRMSYVLNKPCDVILRMVGHDGPTLTYATVVDHEWQEEGHHCVVWDGLDATGNHVSWAAACPYMTLVAEAASGLNKDPCSYATKHANRRPDFRVDIAEPLPATPVAGSFTVVALAEEGYRGMGDTLGYTVSWLLDDRLVEEEPNQDLPVARRVFDAATWSEGSHTIRAAFTDNHKHFGSGSVVVLVPKRMKEEA